MRDELEFRETCPDCGARVGDMHLAVCDVEHCSTCGLQRDGCGCIRHDPELSAWIGLWPGEMTAFLRGWYARLVPGEGWKTCAPDAPGATLDLNRVAADRASNVDRLMSSGYVEVIDG